MDGTARVATSRRVSGGSARSGPAQGVEEKSGERTLFDAPGHLRARAVDVDREKAGTSVSAGTFMCPDEGPDDPTVRLREREGVHLSGFKPVEPTLAHVPGLDLDGSEHPVVEQQPVPLTLEGRLADEPEEMESFNWDMDARFFGDFTLGAVGGRLPCSHVEFPSNRRAEALVGFADAAEKENASIGIAKVAEARQAVGEWGGCL